MASMLNKITKMGVKAIPLLVGLTFFVNTTLINFLPVLVHQIVGGVLVVAGVMALAKKK